MAIALETPPPSGQTGFRALTRPLSSAAGCAICCRACARVRAVSARRTCMYVQDAAGSTHRALLRLDVGGSRWAPPLGQAVSRAVLHLTVIAVGTAQGAPLAWRACVSDAFRPAPAPWQVSAPFTLALHKVTSAWAADFVKYAHVVGWQLFPADRRLHLHSWRQRAGGLPWTSPGGDIVSTPVAVATLQENATTLILSSDAMVRCYIPPPRRPQSPCALSLLDRRLPT
jgi:hypothetical protein